MPLRTSYSAKKRAKASAAEASPKEERRRRRQQYVAIFVALAIFVVAASMLRDAWKPSPVATHFARVGGATRVETAMEAARFWLTAPQRVYLTSASGPSKVILRAAECAMTYDAPLLFTSPSQKRHRKVNRLIRQWRDADRLPQRPTVIRVKRREDCTPSHDTSKTAGLHTLVGNEHLVPDFRSVNPQEELESFAVFAASKAPRSPADVAVGLVLAAHLATPDREVSLVVLPRHLGADSDLDRRLRDSRELVSGGVVVGGAQAISEETPVVLRQILRSSNRTGTLAALRTALGDLGTLIAVLSALLVSGAVATATAAPHIARIERPIRRGIAVYLRNSGNKPGKGRGQEEPEGSPAQVRANEHPSASEGDPPAPAPERTPSDPFAAVESGHRKVTLCLHGEREVRGVYQGHLTIGPVTFVKLGDARISEREKTREAEVLLVPVDHIELAGVQLRRDDS